MTYSRRLAAHAFRLRRFDCLTIRETAQVLGIPLSKVERLVTFHEARFGLKRQLKLCGQFAQRLERRRLAMTLFNEGATAEEIRLILQYSSRSHVSTMIRKHQAEPVSHGRIIVTRGGNDTPQILIPQRAIMLTGWQTGDYVRWRRAQDHLVIWPETRNPRAENILASKEILQAETSCGLSAAEVQRRRTAYEDYCFKNEKLQVTAERLGVSKSSVLRLAEGYSKITGLPWKGRRPQNARDGRLRVSAHGRLALQRASYVMNWLPGSDLLWRVSAGSIVLERFYLTRLVFRYIDLRGEQARS